MIVQDLSRPLVSPPDPVSICPEELIDIDRRKNCESPNEKKCDTEKIQKKEWSINIRRRLTVNQTNLISLHDCVRLTAAVDNMTTGVY